MKRPNRIEDEKPFEKAFVCGAVLWGLISACMFAVGVENASLKIMYVLGTCTWPVLIAGFLGYRSKKNWSWIKMAIVVICIYAVVVVIMYVSRK
jgi:hypothetical protein